MTQQLPANCACVNSVKYRTKQRWFGQQLSCSNKSNCAFTTPLSDYQTNRFNQPVRSSVFAALRRFKMIFSTVLIFLHSTALIVKLISLPCALILTSSGPNRKLCLNHHQYGCLTGLTLTENHFPDLLLKAVGELIIVED